MKHWRARWLRASSLPIALALASAASQARETNRVQTLTVGSSAALAACEGLDAQNDYRARIRFPEQPELAFHTRLTGGIGQAPASDAQGNLFIVHSEARLSRLDSLGRVSWSERLPSEVSAGPVLTSDGAILIVTRGGDALTFSAARGTLLGTQALPVSDPRRRTHVIPTQSGGALIACGSDLVQVDAELHIIRQTRARASLSAILETGGNLLAVSETGSVELARESGDFELLGSFSGGISDGAAVAAGKLFAIVDGHQWAALDLKSGSSLALASDAGTTLSGPAALLPSGGVALVADGAFVSVRGPNGGEIMRSALTAGRTGFDPVPRGSRPALLLSDIRGGLIAVRSGEDAVFLTAEGKARSMEGTSCLDPFRPTPSVNGVILSCRSGQIFAVSDPKPTTSKPKGP